MLSQGTSKGSHACYYPPLHIRTLGLRGINNLPQFLETLPDIMQQDPTPPDTLGADSPCSPGPSWLWLPGRSRNQDSAQTLLPSGFPSCSCTVSGGFRRQEIILCERASLDSEMTLLTRKPQSHLPWKLKAPGSHRLNTCRPPCWWPKTPRHTGLQSEDIKLQKP